MNGMSDANDHEPPPPQQPPTVSKTRYKGVKGWLLFFCIGLTILAPIYAIKSVQALYRELSQYFDQFPRLRVITDIETILIICIMVFSISAGVGLWKIRPGAVRMAKIYLLCNLAFQIIAAILLLLAGFPAEANKAMLPVLIRGSLTGILYVLIWYLYLNKSKRVKATYA